MSQIPYYYSIPRQSMIQNLSFCIFKQSDLAFPFSSLGHITALSLLHGIQFIWYYTQSQLFFQWRRNYAQQEAVQLLLPRLKLTIRSSHTCPQSLSNS